MSDTERGTFPRLEKRRENWLETLVADVRDKTARASVHGDDIDGYGALPHPKGMNVHTRVVFEERLMLRMWADTAICLDLRAGPIGKTGEMCMKVPVRFSFDAFREDIFARPLAESLVCV